MYCIIYGRLSYPTYGVTISNRNKIEPGYVKYLKLFFLISIDKWYRLTYVLFIVYPLVFKIEMKTRACLLVYACDLLTMFQ